MIKLGGRSLKYYKARKTYILALLFLLGFFAGSYMLTTNNAAAVLNTGTQQIAKKTKKDKKNDKTRQNCTSILPSDWCGDNDGEAIFKILDIILYIMTFGVGILGTLGLITAGIQYTTAGDSEEKTSKAKRKIYEVVLGIVAWALLFVLIKWLLPGGIG